MKDDYEDFYESEEANLDSKSDAKLFSFLLLLLLLQ